MKVKIADKLYNVVEIKKSLGITHYCIEDEPNHYDWVNNVEVIEDNNWTDEEKAIELSNKFKCITIGERCKNIEDACYKMAKWKDEQYNEEKKELISLVNMLPVDDHNQTIIEDLIALLR